MSAIKVFLVSVHPVLEWLSNLNQRMNGSIRNWQKPPSVASCPSTVPMFGFLEQIHSSLASPISGGWHAHFSPHCPLATILPWEPWKLAAAMSRIGGWVSWELKLHRGGNCRQRTTAHPQVSKLRCEALFCPMIYRYKADRDHFWKEKRKWKENEHIQDRTGLWRLILRRPFCSSFSGRVNIKIRSPTWASAHALRCSQWILTPSVLVPSKGLSPQGSGGRSKRIMNLGPPWAPQRIPVQTNKQKEGKGKRGNMS